VNSSNNTVVNGSRTWYLPFGGYRPGSAHTQTITDRDFTGQHENMELGLLYYNARFYAPGLGRFISADTIIPNPANPQSYNRYAYVLNRALNFTDPTGHVETPFNEGGGGGAVAGDSDREGAGSVPQFEPAVGTNGQTGNFNAFQPGDAAPIPQPSGSSMVGNIVKKAVERGVTVGSGLCLNDGDCTNEVQSAYGNLTRASEYGIRSYDALRRIIEKGLQAHHIIEKRFAPSLGIQNSGTMPSVAVTPFQHQIFTNAWRAAFPYGVTNYQTLTKEAIWVEAQRIYANYPALLASAQQTLGIVPQGTP
jgi:RHS repeat-associated protein